MKRHYVQQAEALLVNSHLSHCRTIDVDVGWTQIITDLLATDGLCDKLSSQCFWKTPWTVEISAAAGNLWEWEIAS